MGVCIHVSVCVFGLFRRTSRTCPIAYAEVRLTQTHHKYPASARRSPRPRDMPIKSALKQTINMKTHMWIWHCGARLACVCVCVVETVRMHAMETNHDTRYRCVGRTIWSVALKCTSTCNRAWPKQSHYEHHEIAIRCTSWRAGDDPVASSSRRIYQQIENDHALSDHDHPHHHTASRPSASCSVHAPSEACYTNMCIKQII